MDTLAISGVFTYWALSNTAPIRVVFASCAALVLLIEAYLFRRGVGRIAVIVSASGLLYFLVSLPSTLPPYFSYMLIMRVGDIGLELFVATLLLTGLCLAIIVPLRRRNKRRRLIQPIQSVPPQPSSDASSSVVAPQRARAPAQQRASVRSVLNSDELIKKPRRSYITRSHVLASRMHQADLERKEQYLPENLVAARSVRRENERQNSIREANEKVEQAQAQLSKALDELRTAHRSAEMAITTRDEHVRSLGNDVDPSHYDEVTENLFAEARNAEQRKADALDEVTAAQAVLRDVERWASEL